jgi:hypothetical protein
MQGNILINIVQLKCNGTKTTTFYVFVMYYFDFENNKPRTFYCGKKLTA